MKKPFIWVMLLGLLTGFTTQSAEPDVKVKPIVVKVEGVQPGEITLVDRDQLRVGSGTKRFSLDKKMRVALESAFTAPETFDWTKGNTIKFPMLGNDQYGDCYLVALCKLYIAMNANATGKDVLADFPVDKVVKRYLQLSGGDNGLSDSEIFPEAKNGTLGPNGPHKILDYAVVSSTDMVALSLTQFAFGPTLYTFAVPKSVMQNIKPGVLWDTQTGNVIGGHAVLLTGRKKNGNFSLQTWGLNPPVEVTPRFLANNDPECIATFSLEWFNEKGYAPNGFHYETLAPLWTSLTGGRLPASPFPPPVGPTPPVPPAPTPAGTLNFSITDLTPEAQVRLKSSGVTSFNIQLGFGAPPAPNPAPTLMPPPNPNPNPSPTPTPPTPTPTPAPSPGCVGGNCQQVEQQVDTRWKPFGGLFRLR
jgi:hypothetical protein